MGYPARVLGPENYGIVGYATSIVAYAGILLSPGLITWGRRSVAQNRSHTNELLVNINVIRIVLFIIAYSVLTIYCIFFVDNYQQSLIIMITGISLLITSIEPSWVFDGLELMHIPALLRVIGSIIHVSFLVMFIKTPEDIIIYPLIPIFSSAVVMFAIYLFLRKHANVSIKVIDLKKQISFFVQSIPLGLTMALVIILANINNIIIEKFLGVKLLGIFLASFSLLNLTKKIPTIFRTIYLPRLARKVRQNKESAIKEAKLFGYFHITLGIILGALIFSEAPLIINIIFGEMYVQAVTPLKIISIAVIFNFAICGYTNCLIAFNKDKIILYTVFISGIVSVGGALIAIPYFGITGAAIVISFVDLAGFLFSVPYYKKYIAPLQIKKWIAPCMVGVLIIIIRNYLADIEINYVFRLITITLISFIFFLRTLFYEMRRFS